MTTFVGFTGTELGMTPPQFDATAEVFRKFGADVRFHHGMCVGADAEAHQLARGRDWFVVGHPCDLTHMQAQLVVDELREVKRPLDRNQDIVDAVSYLVATPAEYQEVQRSGTWATVRRARKAGIPIHLVYPDGRLEVE
jgi:hypothetical protein